MTTKSKLELITTLSTSPSPTTNTTNTTNTTHTRRSTYNTCNTYNTRNTYNSSPAWQASFSIDGRFLAVCYGAPDSCVRIWEYRPQPQPTRPSASSTSSTSNASRTANAAYASNANSVTPTASNTNNTNNFNNTNNSNNSNNSNNDEKELQELQELQHPKHPQHPKDPKHEWELIATINNDGQEGHSRSIRSVAFAPFLPLKVGNSGSSGNSGRSFGSFGDEEVEEECIPPILATASFDGKILIWEYFTDYAQDSGTAGTGNDGDDCMSDHDDYGDDDYGDYGDGDYSAYTNNNQSNQHSNPANNTKHTKHTKPSRKRRKRGGYECTSQLEGHENEIKSVAWNATGSLLASGGRDKTVWVWECFLPGTVGGADSGYSGGGGGYSGGQEEEQFECLAILQGHEGDVKYVTFAPSNGQWGEGEEILLSASYDDCIKVWAEEAGDWYCAATLGGGGGIGLGQSPSSGPVHSSTVWCLGVAPGGVRFFSGSEDGSMAVWKCYTAMERKKLFLRERVVSSTDGLWTCVGTLPHAHSGYSVLSIDCAPSRAGHGRIVSGGGDNAIHVYREEGGVIGTSDAPKFAIDAMACNAHYGDVNCVQWHPRDGTCLVSVGDDGAVKLWRYVRG